MDITEMDSVTLKVGDKVSYHFKKHESVGFNAEYSISDETILQFVESQTAYAQLEKLVIGMTGADRAKGTFVFQALQAGQATLTVQHLYRGELESEKQIEIKIAK